MTERKLSATVAVIYLLAHIGLVPFVLFYPERLTPAVKFDILLLIGPVTSAYFVSITQYVVNNRKAKSDNSDQASGLYILFSLSVFVAFFAGSYGAVFYVEHGHTEFSPDQIKIPISIAEIFVGGSFALIFKALFPQET